MKRWAMTTVAALLAVCCNSHPRCKLNAACAVELERACDRGNAKACTEAAVWYGRYGHPVYVGGCDSQHPMDCYREDLPPRDPARGAALVAKACKLDKMYCAYVE